MMLTYRLVRLIESHADTLAAGLLAKVRNSARLTDYRNVPAAELQQRVYEIYRHLGEWLLSRKESDLERRYLEIGARRAAQKVPLSQVIWAIIVTKQNLFDFLQSQSGMDRPPEALGRLELLERLEQFFDRAMHHATVGYEQFRASQAVEEALTT